MATNAYFSLNFISFLLFHIDSMRYSFQRKYLPDLQFFFEKTRREKIYSIYYIYQKKTSLFGDGQDIMSRAGYAAFSCTTHSLIKKFIRLNHSNQQKT